jgi:undecaprenyl-diphosphatase
VLAALIAISRMYLFVHFPTDVIVGTLIGISMALIFGYIVKFSTKSRTPQ